MKKIALFLIVLCTASASAFAQADLNQKAQQALLAFKNKNGAALAELAHPTLGIRFTPYAWDELDKNMVLHRKDLAGIFTSKKKILWGHYDGSGDPISMMFAQYGKRFVWNTDYTKVKEKENAPLKDYLQKHFQYLADGDEGQKLLELYPQARVFAYYYPGVTAPQGGAMDWSHLLLIFVPKGDDWFLVGVVHHQWMI